MKKIDCIMGPSCLTEADPDEPIFVLRANDELAPSIVRAWAERYMQSKNADSPATAKQIAKYSEAHRCAKAMEKWKKERE